MMIEAPDENTHNADEDSKARNGILSQLVQKSSIFVVVFI